MTVIIVHKVIDCSGMIAPFPVDALAGAIHLLEVGQVLKLITTDPATLPTMDAWAGQTGHRVLHALQEREATIFFVERAA
jgi:TusA-related sulfurtransferase